MARVRRTSLVSRDSSPPGEAWRRAGCTACRRPSTRRPPPLPPRPPRASPPRRRARRRGSAPPLAARRVPASRPPRRVPCTRTCGVRARAADAEHRVRHAAHRRVREERRLHRAIEIEVERDVAELAVPLGLDLLEATRLLRRRHAARADDAPAQLDQPRRDGLEERAQDVAPVARPTRRRARRGGCARRPRRPRRARARPACRRAAASTPSSFSRCTADADARAASAGDAGLTYGLAAPSRTCASMSAPSAANFAVKSFALIHAMGAKSARARRDLHPHRRARPALERARPVGRARRARACTATSTTRIGTAAHPAVHAEGPLVAPLEGELLVDELEAARARLGDEARARRRPLLDGAVVHVVRADEAVEPLGVGKERPHPLGRGGEVHGARDDDRAHRTEGITRVPWPGDHAERAAPAPPGDHGELGDGTGPRPLPLQLELPSAKAAGAAAGDLRGERRRPAPAQGAAVARAPRRGARRAGRRHRGGRRLGSALVRAERVHRARPRRTASRSPSTTPRSAPRASASSACRATAAAMPGAQGAGARDRGHDARPAARHDDRAPRRAHADRSVEHRRRRALARGARAPSGGQEGAWAPRSLVFDESRVVWQAPFAENARVEASNVHFDLTWSGDVAARCTRGRTACRSPCPAGSSGPGASTSTARRATSRVRVALDPGGAGGVHRARRGGRCGRHVGRRRRPAIAAGAAGAPARAARPEGQGAPGRARPRTTSPMGPERADVTAKGGLYGIEAGLPVPLDVAWDVTATGAPQSGLDVKKARLAAGPLVGALTGHAQAVRRRLPRRPRMERGPRALHRLRGAASARATPSTSPTSCASWPAGVATIQGDVTRARHARVRLAGPRGGPGRVRPRGKMPGRPVRTA